MFELILLSFFGFLGLLGFLSFFGFLGILSFFGFPGPLELFWFLGLFWPSLRRRLFLVFCLELDIFIYQKKKKIIYDECYYNFKYTALPSFLLFFMYSAIALFAMLAR